MQKTAEILTEWWNEAKKNNITVCSLYWLASQCDTAAVACFLVSSKKVPTKFLMKVLWWKKPRENNGFCNQTRNKEENFYLAGKKKQYETYGEEVAFFVIWLITSLLLDEEKKNMMATKLKLSNMFWTVVLLVVSLVSLPMPGKQGNFHVRVHNTYQ